MNGRVAPLTTVEKKEGLERKNVTGYFTESYRILSPTIVYPNPAF